VHGSITLAMQANAAKAMSAHFRTGMLTEKILAAMG
jgi:hypothetical protein